MGLRGFPPKPTVLEIAQGRPGHRPINRSEPKPAALPPLEAKRRCPERLRGRARYWWRYYGPVLAALRVLTEADLVALEKLASTTAQREEMEGQLSKSGPIYKAPNSGYIQISPLFSVVQTLREQELKLLREFGLTPSSRTRVNVVGDQGAADPLEAALCG